MLQQPPEHAAEIGRRVLAGFTEPVRTSAVHLQVSASIGIHVATEDDDDDSLLRAVDSARYDAKRNGQGGIHISCT